MLDLWSRFFSWRLRRTPIRIARGTGSQSSTDIRGAPLLCCSPVIEPRQTLRRLNSLVGGRTQTVKVAPG